MAGEDGDVLHMLSGHSKEFGSGGILLTGVIYTHSYYIIFMLVASSFSN